MRILKALAALLLPIAAAPAWSQQLTIPEPAVTDPAALERAIPGLARQALAQLQTTDGLVRLEYQYRFQLASGQYAGAAATFAELDRQRSPLVSRQLSKGSRLLFIATVQKNPMAQVNHGTGRDVSDESIADAKQPLHVKWHNGSFIDVSLWVGGAEAADRGNLTSSRASGT